MLTVTGALTFDAPFESVAVKVTVKVLEWRALISKGVTATAPGEAVSVWVEVSGPAVVGATGTAFQTKVTVPVPPDTVPVIVATVVLNASNTPPDCEVMTGIGPVGAAPTLTLT